MQKTEKHIENTLTEKIIGSAFGFIENLAQGYWNQIMKFVCVMNLP